MKKLALVGILFSGVLMSAAIAQAKPMGMSNAEYHALIARSEGLNQKHGVDQNSQRPLVSEQLAGLDLSAAASSGPLDPWAAEPERSGEVQERPSDRSLGTELVRPSCVQRQQSRQPVPARLHGRT